jgi:predicted Zn finger-like uncharacterized protein
MILTCPNCSARYLLAGDSIGEKGKSVRCGKCGTEWFQEPQKDSYSAAAASLDQPYTPPLEPQATAEEKSSLDDLINKALEDNIDIDFTSSGEKKTTQPTAKEKGAGGLGRLTVRLGLILEKAKISGTASPLDRKKQIAGFMVALAVFSLFLYALVIPSIRQSIVTAMPFISSAYMAAGFSVTLFSEQEDRLAFDRIEAWRDGDKIKVGGNLINLGSTAFSLTALQVTVLDKGEKELLSGPQQVPGARLESEAVLPVAFEIESAPEEAAKIKLSLSGQAAEPADH